MDSFSSAGTEALPRGATIPGGVPTVIPSSWPTRPSPPNTVTGCTASSGTRPPARATGPAGTALPPSSSVSAASSITRRLTPVTGPRTLQAARSTLCVRKTPTPTCPWESPASGTGHARVDTHGSSVVPPHLCLTSSLAVVFIRPLLIAMCPPPHPSRMMSSGTSRIAAKVSLHHDPNSVVAPLPHPAVTHSPTKDGLPPTTTCNSAQTPAPLAPSYHKGAISGPPPLPAPCLLIRQRLRAGGGRPPPGPPCTLRVQTSLTQRLLAPRSVAQGGPDSHSPRGAVHSPLKVLCPVHSSTLDLVVITLFVNKLC